MLIAIIAFVLIVSVGIGGFVWWKTAPPPPMNAMPVLMKARAELQPSGEGQDAWPGYARLFSQTLGMSQFGPGGNETYELVRDSNFWSATNRALKSADPMNEAAEASLNSLKELLDELCIIAETPQCEWPVFRYAEPGDEHWASFDNKRPEFFAADEVSVGWIWEVVHLQGLLLFASKVSFDAGDIERGCMYLRAAINTTMHLHQSALDSIGFGIFGHKIALQTLREFALVSDLSPDAVALLLEVLVATPERLILSPTYRVLAIVDAGQISELYEYEVADVWSLEEWRLAMEPPSARMIRARVREYLNHLEVIADVPLRQRQPIPQFQHPEPAGMERYTALIRVRDSYLSARAATRIILLLERHHALTGEWPAALEDIMPREDTLDPNTLTPFVYERTPDGPFPFSLAAPPEADFLPPDQRLFTQPRRAIDEQNLSIEAAP